MNDNNPNVIQWNDEVILNAAGRSPQEVHALFRKHNLPLPSAWSVYQWYSRRSIPNRWRPSLVYALMRERKLSVSGLFCAASGDNQ